MSTTLLRTPHQHHIACRPGDSCWPEIPQRVRPVSVFGRRWSPLICHFYLSHWLEIVALGDGADGEEAVRDLREYLRYEYDHLRPSDLIPCLCGMRNFNPPKATLGGSSMQGRSFSDIVPSIESAYEQLPMNWQGRTKVWLLMQGYSDQQVYDLRQDRPHGPDGRNVRGSLSSFDKAHAERIRTETRRAGFQARPQDADEESESPWRRLATALGWTPAEVVALEPSPERQVEEVAA